MQSLTLSELILAGNVLISRGDRVANGVGTRVMSSGKHAVQLWWADILGLPVSHHLSGMGWMVKEDHISTCTRAWGSPTPPGVTSHLDVAEIRDWQ